jgi:hypothetical protein
MRNPAVSAAQYRLAEAVLHGTARGPVRMSKAVAKEIVDRTPAKQRSEFIRPNQARIFYGVTHDSGRIVFKSDSRAEADAEAAKLNKGPYRVSYKVIPYDRGPARAKNITDRALRYRANATPPPGEKRCCLCGNPKDAEVGHVNGHEEDTDPAESVLDLPQLQCEIGKHDA